MSSPKSSASGCRSSTAASPALIACARVSGSPVARCTRLAFSPAGPGEGGRGGGGRRDAGRRGASGRVRVVVRELLPGAATSRDEPAGGAEDRVPLVVVA